MVAFHLKVHPVAHHRDHPICKDLLEVLQVVHLKWVVQVARLLVDLMADQAVLLLMSIQHSSINLVEDHHNIRVDHQWQVVRHMDLPVQVLSKV